MNLIDFDLNLLVALDALLEEQHVTRAAKRVGLSQPAMSNALSRLRAELDDPLLVRTGTGMTPTPRALELIEPVKKALAMIDSALSSEPFTPENATAKVHVTGTSGALHGLVGRLLEEVCARAPGIEITFGLFSTLEDPERRDEVLEKQLASDFPGAKLVKATYSDMTKLERPVEITVTFKGGRLLRESDKRRYLYPLGERKDLLGAYADQAKRNQDLSIRVPFTSKTTMRYRLPVDSKAGKLPAAKNLKSKFGSLDIEYRREKDAVIAEVRYSIDVQRVSASEYPEFRKFMSEATSALNETIDLE